MKNKVTKMVLALMALLLVSGLAACASSGTVTGLEKITVVRGNIVRSISADGALSMPQDRKLSFGTSGKIDQINVNEGDRATAGTLLTKLDTSTLELAVKTAQLAVNSAQIDLESAQVGVTSATIDLEQATDNFRKITYPYSYSTFVFDVPAALDYISNALRQVDDAGNTLKSTMTTDQYNEVTKRLRDAKDNLTNAREQLARGTGQDVFAGRVLATRDYWTLRTAQLQMDKAQASLDNAKNVANKAKLAADVAKYNLDTVNAMLDKAIIKAPFDGVVAQVTVKAGDVLSAVDYNRTIIEFVDPRYMELILNVDEEDVPGIKVGQEAAISIDAMPGTSLTGKVVFVSPISQAQVGVVLYQVKIGFNVPETLGLKAGMSARANIVTARKDNALLVPSRAISQKDGSSTVTVATNGQTEVRKVITGLSDSVNTEIVTGLSENDTVVIGNQLKLTLSK